MLRFEDPPGFDGGGSYESSLGQWIVALLIHGNSSWDGRGMSFRFVKGNEISRRWRSLLFPSPPFLQTPHLRSARKEKGRNRGGREPCSFSRIRNGRGTLGRRELTEVGGSAFIRLASRDRETFRLKYDFGALALPDED